MRIGLIDLLGLDYSPFTPSERPLGGMQSGLCYLALALADRGHEVALINRTSTPGTYSGVRCLRVEDGLRSEQLQQFDVMVSIYCAGLELRNAGINVPLVLWTGHNCDEPTVQRLRRADERSAWSRIVLKSEWQRSGYRDRFGIEPDRLGVIGNAISPSVERLSSERRYFFETKRPPVFFYSSTPFRGLDILIEAFPALRASIPGATARIYSSMAVYQQYGADDRYGHLYDRCAQTDGFDYYGSVSQPALGAALAEADLLAFPSTYEETSCITLMEAMASGCIVVCNDLGALRETSAGFGYFAPYAPAAYAHLRVPLFSSAVLKAVADSVRRPVAMRSTLENQMAFVRANCVWSIRAEQWERYLLKLLERKTLRASSTLTPPGDCDAPSFHSVLGATGHEIFVDPTDERGRCLVEKGGNFNPPVLTAWHRLLKEDRWTHVVDVGANYGEMLANGELPLQAQIIAIEPSPKILPYLRKTLSPLHRVTILDVAISDSTGEADFQVNSGWSGMSRIVGAGSGDIRVPTLTLVDILGTPDRQLDDVRALLKIDIEGHEIAALRSLADVIDRFANIVILVEIAHLSEPDIDWLFARYDVFALRLEGGQSELLGRSDVARLTADGRWDQDVVLRRKPLPAPAAARDSRTSEGDHESNGAAGTTGARRLWPVRGKIAFVTVCKGRLHHIKETLPLIVSEGPEEIVLVDYGCPQNVGDWVEAHFDSVKVVRVADDLEFCVSRGRNIGALSTEAPWICFIDADVKIAPGFVDWMRTNADASCFYRNGLVNGIRDIETYGTFLCSRRAFDAVTGFDEIFRGWGGEDDDIFMRLSRAGFTQAAYPAEFVSPISHGDDERVQFHRLKNKEVQRLINDFYIQAKRNVMDCLQVPPNQELGIEIRKEIDSKIRQGVFEWIANPVGPPPQINMSQATQSHLNGQFILARTVSIKLSVSARPPAPGSDG